MTATEVNGLKVVETDAPHSPLSTPENPVHFKQILRLLLEDGNTTYGCVHCDYTSFQLASVRAHLPSHARGRVDPRKGTKILSAEAAPLMDLSVRELFDAVLQRRESDSWKERALKAEKRLADFRKAAEVLGLRLAD